MESGFVFLARVENALGESCDPKAARALRPWMQ
ncbi:hypothetical protein L917_18858, partial [Phytophthora nicotianae]